MAECDLGRAQLDLRQIKWYMLSITPSLGYTKAHSVEKRLHVPIQVVEGVTGEDVLEGNGLESLTKGEIGLRASIRSWIVDVLSQPILPKVVAMLEDDVLIHRDFHALWSKVVEVPRCSSFLLSDTGGILLLGASELDTRRMGDNRANLL